MAKLTIVTTTYNQEKYIRQALDSFVEQETDFVYEVLISDDCSTDKTREIIEEYRCKYPDIIKPIYRQNNLGPMQNFIQTLSEVKSQYVALCDGDDFWTDSYKLQKQVDFLDNNPEFSICFHQTKIFFEDNSIEDQIHPIGIPIDTELNELVSLSNYIPANTVVYRWKFANESLTLKDEFPADVVPGDYYLHLLHAQMGKIHYMPEVMSAYRRHLEGMWWLNATEAGKEQFSIKYGKQLLNFYDAIEENINVSPENTYIYKRDIIKNAVISLGKTKQFGRIAEFGNNEDNKKILNEIVAEIVQKIEITIEENTYERHLNEHFYSLNYLKKFIYLLFIDSKRRKEMILRKLRKK